MKKYYLSVILAVFLIVATIQVIGATPNKQGGNTIVHEVQFGETVSEIATRYGVPVQAIMRYNRLRNPNAIYQGQQLVIPTGNNPTSYPTFPTCSNYHTIATGETLSDVAQRYNTTIQLLMRINNLRNQDFVYVGQKICLSDAADFAPPQLSDSYHHQVVPGETLSGIAKKYGVTEAEILRANNIQNVDLITIGQDLIIPGYDVLDVPFPPRPTPIPLLPPASQTKQKPPAPSIKAPVLVGLPPAPNYQSDPLPVLLPLADTPIMVEVMGQEAWIGDVYISDFDEKQPESRLVISTNGDVRDVVIRSGDYELRGKTDFDAELGAFKFAFRHIPPGDYDVWLEDPNLPSQKAHVKILVGSRADVNFKKGIRFAEQTYASPDGWILADANNPSKPGESNGGWSNILVRAPAPGLIVILESEGGYRATCLTGSKGENGCDFAGLMAGTYFISIDGTKFKVKTYIDGAAYATFDFGRQPAPSSDGQNKVGPYFIYGR
jgi:LysM repeat protein